VLKTIVRQLLFHLAGFYLNKTIVKYIKSPIIGSTLTHTLENFENVLKI